MVRRRPTDDDLLAALANYGAEWVSADAVERAVRSRDPGVYTSTIGTGRHLTRLARDGRCEARFEGYMNYYRATSP